MALNTKKETTNEQVYDGNIDLGYSTKKKKFTVGGDVNTVIEFDPSDIGVASRLAKSLKDLQALSDKWEKLQSNMEDIEGADTDDSLVKSTDQFAKDFDKLEKSVKDIIDYVFDSDVADKLLGKSSAFSPVNGKFKYEHIIEAMLKCYEQQIQDEAPKFNARKVQNYTNKYVRK